MRSGQYCRLIPQLWSGANDAVEHVFVGMLKMPFLEVSETEADSLAAGVGDGHGDDRHVGAQEVGERLGCVVERGWSSRSVDCCGDPEGTWRSRSGHENRFHQRDVAIAPMASSAPRATRYTVSSWTSFTV